MFFLCMTPVENEMGMEEYEHGFAVLKNRKGKPSVKLGQEYRVPQLPA